MAIYNYVVAKNTKGEDITVSVEFEHTKRELRCLAVMHDADAYQWAIVNAGKLVLLSEGQYSVPYPFSTPLKPWSVYIWRSTTEDEDVTYNDARVPVEAIVAKLAELSRKADENKRESERALRTPEGASDSFVPPEDVRAGKVLGFDDEGKPAVGNNVKQVAELFEVQNTCENYANAAASSASEAAASAAQAGIFAENAAASADESAASADNSKLYYDKTVATFQKVDAAVASGLEEIEETANAAQETIVTTLGESVELCRQYKEAAAGSADNAANSESLSQEAADKCEALLAQAVKGWTTKIVSSLPSSPDVNTVYFVGNDDDGYTMRIYSNGEWVTIGNTSFAENRPMTVSSYGLGKLSTETSQSLSTAGMIGVNSAGQLLAMKASTGFFGTVRLSTDAEINPSSDDYTLRGGEIGLTSDGQAYAVTGTLDRFGALRLGSKYQPTNIAPYVVGIGASTNDGKVGQLAFNLKPTQSDGTAGCLKYAIKDGTSGDTLQYEMYVEDASASQKGVCRLITSLTGYTDEEIEEMRDTCAASVGLVTDTVDTYVTDFCSEARISGFFDNWAKGKDLASQIWEDEEKRGALEVYIGDFVESSSVLQTAIETKVSTWLTGTITDEYLTSLFGDKAIEVCKAAVDEHWTEDLELAIDEAAELTAEKHTESRVLAYLSEPSNLGVLSEVIKNSSITEILEAARDSAEEGAAEYVRQVFDGEAMITIDEAKVYFSEYAKAQMQAISDALTTEVQTRIATLESKMAKMAVSKRFTGGTWKQISYDTSYDISTCDLILLTGSWKNKTRVIRVEELYAMVESGAYSTSIGFTASVYMGSGSKGTWSVHNVISINITKFPTVSFSSEVAGNDGASTDVYLHYPEQD